MSVKAPLGATPEGGAFDVTAALVEPRHALSRPLPRARAERIGIAATLSVPLLGLLLCMAGTRTGALVPATISLWPPNSTMAGPLEFVGFTLTVGELIAVLLLLVGAYLLAIRYSEHVSPRLTIWAIAAFTVIVLIGPPLFSTDVFSYQAYGKMFAVYHMNPYVHGPSVIFGDPLYNYIGARWIKTPSVYGPLFTFLSSAFSGASIPFNEFAYKLIAGAASAGTLSLIWKSAQRRRVDPARAIALFGLNPLITLYGVGGAHNDLLMLLLTSAGIYAVLRRRDRSAGTLITTAAAIKLTGAIVLPFALLGEAGPAAGNRRGRLLVGAVATAALMATASYLAFGTNILHMTHTLQDVQDQGQGQSFPGLVFWLAHLSVTHWVRTGVGVVAAAVVVWLLLRVWQGRMDWIDAAAWATFVVLASAWTVVPWYVSWLMPLVALSTSKRLWNVATLATLAGGAIMIAGCFPSWNLF